MINRFTLFAISILIFEMNSEAQVTGSFTDSRDGKIYKTVQIGWQIWMAENLNYKTDTNSCCYNNNDSMCTIYGKLYTWVEAKKACPSGWHLPSADEWWMLVKYRKDTIDFVDKIKLDVGWKNPVKGTICTIRSFTALPGGYRNKTDAFKNIGKYSYWWSSSEIDSEKASGWRLDYDSRIVNFGNQDKQLSYSVRCAKNS